MERYTYHDLLAYLGVGGAHPGGLPLTKEIVRELPIKSTDHILDAGCGTGQTAAFLADQYGCHVTAMDQHPIMIEKSKERFTDREVTVDLVKGNIENSQLEAGTFDWIIVESVTVFTNIEKAVNEYWRLLRTGGVLIDLEMTAADSLSKEELGEFQSLYGLHEIPKASDWKRIFKMAGFRTVDSFKEDTVAEVLMRQSFDTEAFAQQEIDFSVALDPALYEIWDHHQLLTEAFANRLKYVVYRAEKG